MKAQNILNLSKPISKPTYFRRFQFATADDAINFAREITKLQSGTLATVSIDFLDSENKLTELIEVICRYVFDGPKTQSGFKRIVKKYVNSIIDGYAY